MCGIAGSIRFKGEPRADVAAMVQTIRHRGPDAQKTFARGPVRFGHARLRILDLDPQADQPFFNNAGDLVVVFNGEIYNYKDIRAELPAYDFKTSCDTEVILAAYEAWGTKCVERFNGMFAFVLFDLKNGAAFAARDRFGVKPLYYAWREGEELLFASEIKALLSQLPPATPNEAALVEYLLTDCCEHREDTFFAGVSQLLPGEQFVFDPKGFRRERYYDFKDKMRVDRAAREEDAPAKMRELLASSVAYRVQSDVPVGLYYSGGIDSTALAGALRTIPAQTQMRSLTAFSDDVPEGERQLVRDMAQALGLAPSFCDSRLEDPQEFMRRTMAHMEMPFSPSMACDDALNRAAKEAGLVVVLEGQGSDEAQAGYLKYYLPYLQDCLFQGKLAALADGLLNPPAPLTPRKAFFGVLRLIAKEVLGRKEEGGLPRAQARYLQGLLARSRGYAQTAWPQKFASRLEGASYRDMYGKLQRVFRYKDRISMAYSRELRVPFLDFRIFEYMASLPATFKIKSGVQKVVLRRAVEGLVPAQAAQIPKNHLLKEKISAATMTALREETAKILSDPRAQARGLYDAQALVTDWRAGRVPSGFFWRVGQIELWFQTFIDARG